MNMRRFLGRSILYIFIILILDSFTVKVSNAAARVEKSSQTWICMKGTDSHYDLTWHDPPSAPTLTQQLTGEGFIDGRDIYVVACMPEDNTHCTTGEADSDRLLFGKDNTMSTSRDAYGTSITYSIMKVDGGSKKRSKSGKITATAAVGGANAVASGGYTFYGVMISPSNIVQQPGLGAEQQGTFSFATGNSVSKCVKISWTHYDPFGIVFDSQSLEPLPNVKVTILDAKKRKLSLIGFKNPQVTKQDGLFNFLVEPGIYYLDITPIPTGYSFIANPNIHENYKVIYHQADGGISIYKPMEAIHEEIDTPIERINGMPDPERRDIPLDPGKNPSYRINPIIMDYGVTRLEDITAIEGKASHPFTKITLLQANEIIASQSADRHGFFDLQVDNQTVKQDLPMTLVLSKVNLTKSPLSLTESRGVDMFSLLHSIIAIPSSRFTVNAEGLSLKSFIKINPIFPFLRGFAHDAKGKVIPNATVDVKLAMTGKTYYQTNANQTGYFSVQSQDLPIFNYDIAVTNPSSGGIKSYTTSDFAKVNKTYLASNKINLMGAFTVRTMSGAPQKNTFSAARGDVATASSNVTGVEEQNNIIPKESANQETAQKSSTKIQSSSSTRTALFIILATLLFMAGATLIVVLFLYIKKKQQSPISMTDDP